MKKSDIYEIAIKILGLYVFFRVVGLIYDLLATFAVMAQEQEFLGSSDNVYLMLFLLSIVNFVVVFLFAWFLTFKTKAIVKYVCKPIDYEETSSLFADRKVIYEIALAIMGLLLILWTLPDFIIKLKNYMVLSEMDMPRTDPETNFIITAGIKIVVGLIAVIYAKSIAPFLAQDKKSEPAK